MADAPPLKYHYTDSAGLLGIIGEGKCLFWASDVRFLNDSEELRYAARQFEQWLLSCHQRTLPTEIGRLLESEPGIYVVCLSERRDSLSQWRAYGDYALGFDLPEVRYQNPDRTPVDGELYFPTLAMQGVSYGLDSIAEARFEQAFEQFEGPWTEHGLTEGIRGRATVLPVLAMVKHPCFADEREWRILYCHGGETPTPEGFRNGPMGVVPYITAQFDKDALREIMVGPGPHQDVRVAGARALLDAHGFRHVAVTKSELPYRG
jgi:hypothetical protein